MEVNDLNKNARGGTELIHEQLESRIDQELLKHFQLIPSRVRDLDPTRKPVLVLHDLPGDPESNHLTRKASRSRFKGIVGVSHWQVQGYSAQLGIPPSELRVIQNAIVPIPMHTKPNDGTIRLIYHSTPHRGLNILVPVFEKLCEYFDNIELDVYSSFNLYGWGARDAEYEELFERCRQHPKINYHGAVSNDEIRTALQKADIFAYPNTWLETSCLCLIEAMSAGLVCVTSSNGALPETAANFALMYPFTENMQDHANRFANHLAVAINTVNGMKAGTINTTGLEFQKSYFNNFYSWDYRIRQWEDYLKSLL